MRVWHANWVVGGRDKGGSLLCVNLIVDSTIIHYTLFDEINQIQRYESWRIRVWYSVFVRKPNLPRRIALVQEGVKI